ncbi:MAG: helix-turn-helix transcriptional regulator [Caldibacillus thermoamylovorans]|jgi:transcriptional regulator with XRE-family HTH domain
MKMCARLKYYIESNGLKLNFVAEKSGINQKRFYRLINGNAPLTVEEYEKICSGLSVEPGYFFKENFLETKKKQNKEVS